MLDLNTGEILLLNGTVGLRPQMSLTEFQATPLFPLSRECGPIDQRFRIDFATPSLVFLGARFSFHFYFTNEILTGIHLTVDRQEPVTGWWSALRKLLDRMGLLNSTTASEAKIAAEEAKAFDDEWLQRAIGQSCSVKYYPPWGEIRSEYDEERVGAWIAINYA